MVVSILFSLQLIHKLKEINKKTMSSKILIFLFNRTTQASTNLKTVQSIACWPLQLCSRKPRSISVSGSACTCSTVAVPATLNTPNVSNFWDITTEVRPTATERITSACASVWPSTTPQRTITVTKAAGVGSNLRDVHDELLCLINWLEYRNIFVGCGLTAFTSLVML